MATLPVSVYFIFNVFLFVMALYLFVKATPDLMRKRAYSIFKIFIVAFEFYLIVNTIWTMQEFDVIQMPRFLFKVVCYLSLSAVLFNCVCFYKLVMVYFGYSDKQNKMYEFFGFLPFLISEVFMTISLWNGMVFDISEDMRIVHGDLYIVLMVAAFIYFVIIFVSSLVEMVRRKSPQARKNCLTIFLVVTFLVGWVIVDNVYDSVTILPIAIFSVILALFTTFQQSSINTDSLTQMNNRRKAMEYLSSQLANVSEDAPMHLYMCDVNFFKKINDTYGHLEGDDALIILANAIKQQMNKFHGFAARYGGDEFIIAIKGQDTNYDEKEIMICVENAVKDLCKTLNKPYCISVAYGYVKCTDPAKSFDEYIVEADDLLYESKNNR